MKRSGFTLIELLIVVAIIAILAAIAVPNFLEAQVRSKISRCKTDMRTLSIAIESYLIDNGKCPPGTSDYPGGTNLGYGSTNSLNNQRALSNLTTPIAYMSSIPYDPFFTKNVDVNGRQTYAFFVYRSNATGADLVIFKKGYIWGLQSKGPGPEGAYGSQQSVPQGLSLAGILSTPAGILWIYDPTNGSKSPGRLIRTNKGELTGSAY